MAQLHTTVEVKGKLYEHQSGVVIGDKFLNRADFEILFKDLLAKSNLYHDFRLKIMNARKAISIIQTKLGQKNISEFVSDLDAVSTIFSEEFLGGLGGTISLMTSFNFGSADQSIYYLTDEKSLPSAVDEKGVRTYYNAKKELMNLKDGAQKLKKLNDALNNHLNGFSAQLKSKSLQSKDDYINMRKWSYYNMRQRYKAFPRKRHHYGSISIADYFWGKNSQVHGFILESFGTHLALMHPNAFLGQHVKNLRKSVIEEHGGPGSTNLFNILNSSKGNVSSQLSGDIVTVDGRGNVKFNIQSKGSTGSSYHFTLTYTRFLSNVRLFLDTYEKYLDGSTIDPRDIDDLFNKFSTKAWVPIKKKLEEAITKEDNKLMSKLTHVR